MKKYTLHLIALFTLFTAWAERVYAITLNDFQNEVFRPENLPGGPSPDQSVETSINSVFQFGTNFILYASGSIAVLLLVVGGIMYVVSLGSQERMDKAKNIIQYALIGLLVVMFAYAIVTNVINLIYKTTTP